MVTKTVQKVKKTPRLSESQFHINNTAYGIKALERWREKGQITDDDAQLMDHYLTTHRADKQLSQGRVSKIMFTSLHGGKSLNHSVKIPLKKFTKG
jgi:hypothetical protein